MPCQREAGLAAGHCQVDIRQQLGIEQRAVQLAPRVVDIVAFAQGIQAVALPRMARSGQQQGVENGAVLGQVGTVLLAQQRELVVDEPHVECRVVDDQRGALDEREELLGYIAEAGLANQEGIGDAVDVDRALVTFAVRLQVDVEVPARQAPADHLDAANLDDAVPLADRHTRGFGIEDNEPLVLLLLHLGDSNLLRLQRCAV